MKVVRLSALSAGRLYLPGDVPGNIFFERLSQSQGHIAAGRIKTMKVPNGTIGNQRGNLPGFNVVPQPTAPPLAQTLLLVLFITTNINDTSHDGTQVNEKSFDSLQPTLALVETEWLALCSYIKASVPAGISRWVLFLQAIVI
jgi:hypothetical protein